MYEWFIRNHFVVNCIPQFKYCHELGVWIHDWIYWILTNRNYN
jgi:hypothetical protein